MNDRLAVVSGVVILIAAVLLSGYQGRQALVDSQRAGCERGKLDRRANARAIRRHELRAWRVGAWEDSRVFAFAATDLENRSALVCENEFPDASLIDL